MVRPFQGDLTFPNRAKTIDYRARFEYLGFYVLRGGRTGKSLAKVKCKKCSTVLETSYERLARVQRTPCCGIKLWVNEANQELIDLIKLCRKVKQVLTTVMLELDEDIDMFSKTKVDLETGKLEETVLDNLSSARYVTLLDTLEEFLE